MKNNSKNRQWNIDCQWNNINFHYVSFSNSPNSCLSCCISLSFSFNSFMLLWPLASLPGPLTFCILRRRASSSNVTEYNSSFISLKNWKRNHTFTNKQICFQRSNSQTRSLFPTLWLCHTKTFHTFKVYLISGTIVHTISNMILQLIRDKRWKNIWRKLFLTFGLTTSSPITVNNRAKPTGVHTERYNRWTLKSFRRENQNVQLNPKSKCRFTNHYKLLFLVVIVVAAWSWILNHCFPTYMDKCKVNVESVYLLSSINTPSNDIQE